MPFSKRTLMKWRKEALTFREDIKSMGDKAEPTLNMLEILLLLTQELIDQQLLKD